LEILVLRPDADKVAIQDALVENDSEHFFTLSARKSHKGSRMLYYRIPRTPHSIKVDLLLSDDSDSEIPNNLHVNHFENINDVRVAPLQFVLYQELGRWYEEHSDEDSDDEDQEESHKAILRMAQILQNEEVNPLEKTHLGRDHLQELNSRVSAFCSTYGPAAAGQFRVIGFEV
jgi:hypothetical protein